MTTKQHLAVNVIWMIRRNLCDVLRIEDESFEFAWTEEDFLNTLRQRNSIGMIAEDHDDRVCGFFLYELHKSRINVLNFAVAPWCRHQGVGTAMVQKLIYKLSQQRRCQIILDVRETNLGAQQFFSRLGFRAVSVSRGHYEDTDEDAYHFVYDLDEQYACGDTESISVAS